MKQRLRCSLRNVRVRYGRVGKSCTELTLRCLAVCAVLLQVLPKYQSVVSQLYDRLRVVALDELLPAVDRLLQQTA